MQLTIDNFVNAKERICGISYYITQILHFKPNEKGQSSLELFLFELFTL